MKYSSRPKRIGEFDACIRQSTIQEAGEDLFYEGDGVIKKGTVRVKNLQMKNLKKEMQGWNMG